MIGGKVEGDCGWCSGVAQVVRQVGPGEFGHRGGQGGSAHREEGMGFEQICSDVGFFGGEQICTQHLGTTYNRSHSHYKKGK